MNTAGLQQLIDKTAVSYPDTEDDFVKQDDLIFESLMKEVAEHGLNSFSEWKLESIIEARIATGFNNILCGKYRADSFFEKHKIYPTESNIEVHGSYVTTLNQFFNETHKDPKTGEQVLSTSEDMKTKTHRFAVGEYEDKSTSSIKVYGTDRGFKTNLKDKDESKIAVAKLVKQTEKSGRKPLMWDIEFHKFKDLPKLMSKTKKVFVDGRWTPVNEYNTINVKPEMILTYAKVDIEPEEQRKHYAIMCKCYERMFDAMREHEKKSNFVKQDRSKKEQDESFMGTLKGLYRKRTANKRCLDGSRNPRTLTGTNDISKAYNGQVPGGKSQRAGGRQTKAVHEEAKGSVNGINKSINENYTRKKAKGKQANQKGDSDVKRGTNSSISKLMRKFRGSCIEPIIDYLRKSLNQNEEIDAKTERKLMDVFKIAETSMMAKEMNMPYTALSGHVFLLSKIVSKGNRILTYKEFVEQRKATIGKMAIGDTMRLTHPFIRNILEIVGAFSIKPSTEVIATMFGLKEGYKYILHQGLSASFERVGLLTALEPGDKVGVLPIEFDDRGPTSYLREVSKQKMPESNIGNAAHPTVGLGKESLDIVKYLTRGNNDGARQDPSEVISKLIAEGMKFDTRWYTFVEENGEMVEKEFTPRFGKPYNMNVTGSFSYLDIERDYVEFDGIKYQVEVSLELQELIENQDLEGIMKNPMAAVYFANPLPPCNPAVGQAFIDGRKVEWVVGDHDIEEKRRRGNARQRQAKKTEEEIKKSRIDHKITLFGERKDLKVGDVLSVIDMIYAFQRSAYEKEQPFHYTNFSKLNEESTARNEDTQALLQVLDINTIERVESIADIAEDTKKMVLAHIKKGILIKNSAIQKPENLPEALRPKSFDDKTKQEAMDLRENLKRARETKDYVPKYTEKTYADWEAEQDDDGESQLPSKKKMRT